MRHNKKIIIFLIIAILSYAFITFGAPADPATTARYDISELQLRLLSLTVVVPLSFIWFIAFYGYTRFKDYAQIIHETKDGKPFSEVATGLAVLAISMPITTIFSSLVRVITRTRPELTPVATIMNHYVTIGLTIFAFWYIHKGASRLLKLTKDNPKGRDWGLLLGVFIGLAMTYVYLVLTNPARNTSGPTVDGQSIFYLPDWLIVTTIILPYLYIWYIGFVSGFYINYYQKKVAGIIYKDAFRYLGLGIIAVIVSSVFRQYFTVTSNLLVDLRLASMLVVVYTLLITIAAGFVLIAIGARKLKHIEEV